MGFQEPTVGFSWDTQSFTTLPLEIFKIVDMPLHFLFFFPATFIKDPWGKSHLFLKGGKISNFINFQWQVEESTAHELTYGTGLRSSGAGEKAVQAGIVLRVSPRRYLFHN